MRLGEEGVNFASPPIERQRVRSCFRRHHLLAAHCPNIDDVNYAWIADRDVKAPRLHIEEDHVRGAAQGNIAEHPADAASIASRTPASQAHNSRSLAGSRSRPCGPSAEITYSFDILVGSRASIATIRAGDAMLTKNISRAASKTVQRVRPGTLISAVRSRRPMSTTDTVCESGTDELPTLAAIRVPRAASNASPFGLLPTATLKASRSAQGANTETVFSPRLLVKTRPRASVTSAPATAVRPGIDLKYRSRAQSIMSMELLLVCAT